MKRILLFFVLLSVIPSLSRDLRAATPVYTVGVGNGSVSTNGDLLVFPGATLSVSNLPGGGRMVTLSGLVGSGGGTNTTLVSSNCIAQVSLGGNTNAIAVDTNCLYAEGFAMEGDLTTLSNYLAGIFTGSGVTNGLATITFVNNLSNYLAGAINTVTNGLAALSLLSATSNTIEDDIISTAGVLQAEINSLPTSSGLTTLSNTVIAAINTTNGNTLTVIQNTSNTLAGVLYAITNGLATIGSTGNLSNTLAGATTVASNLAATANSAANAASNVAATALQPASTNGFATSIINGGNSGNGSVAFINGVATITFPTGASVFGTNSVAGINGLVSNVTIAASGNLTVNMTASISGGTITIAATAPLTNDDSVIFHNFSTATTNDSIGFFYGTDLDTSLGGTNLLYSVATCTATNVNSGYAYAKLMVPSGTTNLVAIGMHFKLNQAAGGSSNVVIVVSSALLQASAIFTASVTSIVTDTQTNFPTAGTFLTNNLAGKRLDLRWNVSMAATSINVTAESGIGQDFKWIQQ